MTDPIALLLGEWSMSLNAYSAILRLFLSLILSAIIGCERSNKRHSAGLRTFITVAMTSTIGALADLSFSGSPYISTAIIIGLGFLASNTLFYSSRKQIKGLTTSSGLIATGVIALLCGFGMYLLSIVSFLFLCLVLSILPKAERYLKNRSNHFEIHLELNEKSKLQDFVTTIRRLGLRIDDIEYNLAYANTGLSVYSISLSIVSDELRKYKTHYEIIEALKSLDYVAHIEEMA